MGSRPFVLVMETAHRDAPTTQVRYVQHNDTPPYVALGLIEQGKFAMLRDAGLLVCLSNHAPPGASA